MKTCLTETHSNKKRTKLTCLVLDLVMVSDNGFFFSFTAVLEKSSTNSMKSRDGSSTFSHTESPVGSLRSHRKIIRMTIRIYSVKCASGKGEVSVPVDWNCNSFEVNPFWNKTTPSQPPQHATNTGLRQATQLYNLQQSLGRLGQVIFYNVGLLGLHGTQMSSTVTDFC